MNEIDKFADDPPASPAVMREAKEMARARRAGETGPLGMPLYTIKGRASRGRETPRFDATLRHGKLVLAKLSSDGNGGCARVDWTDAAPKGSVVRADAERWLADEAERLWVGCGYEPHGDVAKTWPAFEAAILVVPEYV